MASFSISQTNVPQISTNSAVSPLCTNRQPDNFCAYSIQYVLMQHGYVVTTKLDNTLQGSVWRAHSAQNKNKKFIVKVAQKLLHNKSMAYIYGKEVMVEENVVKEAKILQFLSINNPPKSLAKYENFIEDELNYFLVVVDGGDKLFDFVKRSHKLIQNEVLSVTEWQRFCKIAISQMIEVIYWLHNKMHTAHLDISMENFCISDVNIVIQKISNPDGTICERITFKNDFQVKLIDFGLAEIFGGNNFRCSKFVGKTLYKAPKVFSKKEIFRANLADCWSFGILMFSMIIGTIPFRKPCNDDKLFVEIINGRLFEYLCNNKIISMVTPKIFDLISLILKPEEYRINMEAIKKHSWFIDG